MPLFETKKSNILRDLSVLDTQSDPPDGILLCRETLLTFMASNVSNIFYSVCIKAYRVNEMFSIVSVGYGKNQGKKIHSNLKRGA